MPGRPKDRRHFRLASGRQLWRLNQLGRLRLVADAPSISSSEAKTAIGAELERSGQPRLSEPAEKFVERL
jgi:hypothetical protein